MSVLSISGSLVSGWVAQDGNSGARGEPVNISRERGHGACGLMVEPKQANGAYAHDVMEAILVSKNNETAAMLLYQFNTVGVQLFSYFNTFFCSSKFAWLLDT